MADIRKRTGSKGISYQVRYPNKASETGYAYKTFLTMKEAREFRENSSIRSTSVPLSSEIRTVAQGLQKWMEVCEKEGRNGRDPVTAGTLENYRYRAAIITAYPWPKALHELTGPDAIEFRSWLLRHHSRDMAQKVLTSLHSMVREMMARGIIAHDFMSGISIQTSSRYDEPVTIPTERDIHALLKAADRLANSKNEQTRRSWQRYRPMLYLAADSGILASNDANRAREAEANRFAASLLMPKALFQRDIRRLGTPETQHIVKLAGDYEVSKEAAARRYTELCDHRCAVVFSRHGKFRHFCKTKTFPFIDIRRDQPLPHQSISARANSEPGQLSEWSETESTIWISEAGRLGGKVLYEQYLDQANGYRLSMLSIDDAPDDESEPDEDEELEESWTPKFRK
jgi:hypothetical protein